MFLRVPRPQQTTRALAEEQFMKRALAEKILAGIPMRDFGVVVTAAAGVGGPGARPEWS